MKESLAELCSIQTGITLRRGSSAPDPTGDTFLLSIHDMEGLVVRPCPSEPQSFDSKIDRYLIEPGDVLFTNRGTLTKAAVMPDHAGIFVAPAHLSILRPVDPARLNPRYLALYLLSEEAAHYFRPSREGSAIPLISKTALAKLPVPLPDRQTQEKLIQLHLLVEKEKQLHSQLNDLHRRQLQYALSHQ